MGGRAGKLLAALAAAVLAAGTTVTAGETVRIATDAPYAPMEYLNPDGTFTGFDIDLGNELCKRAGFECTWQDQEWEGMFPGLLSRKYDAIMSSMTINERRRKQALFSDAYIVVPSAFFVAVDSPLTEISEDTLRDKRIGVQRGTVQDDYVSATYGKIARIVRYQTGGDVTVDMEVGRLDTAFFDQITGQSDLIEAHPGKYHQIGPDLVEPKEYFGEGFGIAFRKRDTALAEAFNRALAEVRADGTYARIYEQYFHKAPPELAD